MDNREKRLLAFIAAANVLTQMILNVALNLVNYYSGSLAFTLSYVLFELIVFTVEAVLFTVLFRRFSEEEKKRSKIILYALIANALSFGLGLWLSHLISGIF